MTRSPPISAEQEFMLLNVPLTEFQWLFSLELNSHRQQSGSLQAGPHAEKHTYHFIIKLERHSARSQQNVSQKPPRRQARIVLSCARHGILIQSREMESFFFFFFGLLLFSENGQCHMGTTNWVNCISGQRSMCQAAKPVNTRGCINGNTDTILLQWSLCGGRQ